LRPTDTLVVWKLDRLGRSLPHLVETVRDFVARGVGFKSLQENIDTTTSGGSLRKAKRRRRRNWSLPVPEWQTFKGGTLYEKLG